MLIELRFGIIEVGLAPNLTPDLTLSYALLLQPLQFSFPLRAGSVDIRRQIVGRKHPVVEIILHAANHEVVSLPQLAEQAFHHRLREYSLHRCTGKNTNTATRAHAAPPRRSRRARRGKRDARTFLRSRHTCGRARRALTLRIPGSRTPGPRQESRSTCSTADRDRGAARAGPEQARPRTARRAAAAGSPWSYRRSRLRAPSNPSTAGLPAFRSRWFRCRPAAGALATSPPRQ